MKILDINSSDFSSEFEKLLQRGAMDMDEVSKTVLELLKEVKKEGDKALYRHIKKFDKWSLKDSTGLRITQADMQIAYESIDIELKNALKLAYERIKRYHEKLMPKTWLDFEKNGNILGQKVTPVERAGLYIPGGKAAYPSSLLMNAIPAIVAGVEDIVVCTPAPNGELNELLLAAMHICNIKNAYRVGGASAIGAMAYGTESIPKVDVITGPGNIFVATAKKLVFGDVNIDMIAGPSEIGILADKSADTNLLAIDLLSQAEHDQMASSLLVTTSKEVANKTKKSVYSWLEKLERKNIARESIEKRGAIIVTNTMDEAIEIMNKIAPEHLEIVAQNEMEFLSKIKHAGAIFLGRYTPEPIGDYIAGPNHTLPTGGTARFYSPLGVDNFLKKSSIISMSKEGIREIGEACALLAKTEGLGAHEASVRERL